MIIRSQALNVVYVYKVPVPWARVTDTTPSNFKMGNDPEEYYLGKRLFETLASDLPTGSQYIPVSLGALFLGCSFRLMNIKAKLTFIARQLHTSLCCQHDYHYVCRRYLPGYSSR